MQINLNPDDGAGNEIAFLFGAALHDLARTIDAIPASAMIYSLAIGAFFILLKLLADWLEPLVRTRVQRFRHWLKVFSNNTQDYERE